MDTAQQYMERHYYLHQELSDAVAAAIRADSESPLEHIAATLQFAAVKYRNTSPSEPSVETRVEAHVETHVLALKEPAEPAEPAVVPN